jgi:phosphoribosylaminoimidazole-succinocarboxamide synthase
MSKKRIIYEGKAKILYEGPEPGTLIQYFKDDATAFNAQKRAVLDGKGVLNNRISEFMMTRLSAVGIPTHFIRRLNMREQLVKKVDIIPLEVVVRNVAAGTLSKRLGIEEGQVLPRPMVEFYLKDDALGDPLVTEEHIAAFGWAAAQEYDDLIAMSLILLADEISPDSCRLWDFETGDKLDKDRFRRDLGGVTEAYAEVARRLGILKESGESDNVVSFTNGK